MPQFFANPQIFCGKMLDGGVEKAHKAVRANELPRRGCEKKTFAKMKKLVDSESEAAKTAVSRRVNRCGSLTSE